MTTNTTTKPFEFQWGSDGPSLSAAVYQALGAASSCWENLADAGEFQSTRALAIGEALMEYINEEQGR